MLIEVNAKGKTHCEYAPGGSTSQPCRASDITFGGRCLNCGWVADHTEDRDYLDRRKEPCEPKN